MSGVAEEIRHPPVIGMGLPAAGDTIYCMPLTV